MEFITKWLIDRELERQKQLRTVYNRRRERVKDMSEYRLKIVGGGSIFLVGRRGSRSDIWESGISRWCGKFRSCICARRCWS